MRKKSRGVCKEGKKGKKEMYKEVFFHASAADAKRETNWTEIDI